MAFPFWGDPWLYLWLDPSRKFQPLCHHGSPWVTMGHRGSLWVTVHLLVPLFVFSATQGLQQMCKNCWAICGSSGTWSQVLATNTTCESCQQLQIWTQINCINCRLSIEPGTSTRHVPERKHPSTQLGPGRLQVIGIYSFSIRPSRIKNPLYPLFNS